MIKLTLIIMMLAGAAIAADICDNEHPAWQDHCRREVAALLEAADGPMLASAPRGSQSVIINIQAQPGPLPGPDWSMMRVPPPARPRWGAIDAFRNQSFLLNPPMLRSTPWTTP